MLSELVVAVAVAAVCICIRQLVRAVPFMSVINSRAVVELVAGCRLNVT